jgi:Ran GTPase-activating protein (RanGAP) involved in mRNA processing and transport
MPADARLVRMAIFQNKQLATLKLGYNSLGDAGVAILTQGLSGTAVLSNLQSLDLGFNNIGDAGCVSLCRAAISERLQTLYLAGNLIGEDGAMAIADLIRRKESRLRKLYLTGNMLGPGGVTAIVAAIQEEEAQCLGEEFVTDVTNGEKIETVTAQDALEVQHRVGFMEELYFGGTGIGTAGCEAVARLLQTTGRLLVVSLPNCEINDDSLALLASSIKTNRARLPLRSLQLSFNQITCKGVEILVNALWGTSTLKELLIDNNEIADRGAQHIAAVLLPQVRSMETLNVGFNQIKPTGIKILLKSVVDSGSALRSLSISGNPIDTSAAKAISYALAYNRTLVSLSLVHCNIAHEGQRHISAGIVSNSRIALRDLSGFDIGAVIVTLGFPAPMEHWSNGQILEFLRAMWDSHLRADTPPRGDGGESLSGDSLGQEEEYKTLDPLNCLGGAGSLRSAPKDATIVVEVARKAFTEFTERGEVYFRSQRMNSAAVWPTGSSPLVSDDTMLVSSSQERSNEIHDSRNGPYGNRSVGALMPANKVASFVATPEATSQATPDPERRKRLAEWLNVNSKQIHRLAQQPFHAGELWRLHQHYFTPVVNETGGEPVPSASIICESAGRRTPSSVAYVSMSISSENPCGLMSENAMSELADGNRNRLSSLPILKRKVSYGCLKEVTTLSTPAAQDAVPLIVESRPTVQSMRPKTKRARRNRTRISFLPRTKAKLDSYLDKCHEKALITMRQLYFIERAVLDGNIYPLDRSKTHRPLTHLRGELALDAETIVVDML